MDPVDVEMNAACNLGFGVDCTGTWGGPVEELTRDVIRQKYYAEVFGYGHDDNRLACEMLESIADLGLLTCMSWYWYLAQ